MANNYEVKEKLKSTINSSTPMRTNLRNVFAENKTPSSIGSPPAASKINKSTYLNMVIEAINAIGVPRKGASYIAIKKWITDNKEVDAQRIKRALKVAVKKGIDKGILVRPAKSEAAVGAIGSFILAKTKSLKSLKNAVNKPVKPINKTFKKLPKANKETSPTKANGIKSKTVKLASNGQKIVTEASKKSKKTEAQKNPVTKVPSKVEAEKKSATKASSKAKVEKKVATKALSKMEVEKKLPTKVTLKKKAPLENIPKPTEKNVSNDSQSDEDPANGEIISEAPKRGKVNAKSQVKTKAMKPTDNDTVFGDFQSDENPVKEVVIPVGSTRRKAFATNKTEKNVQSGVHTPAIKDKKVHTPAIKAKKVHTPAIKAKKVHTPAIKAKKVHTPAIKAKKVRKETKNQPKPSGTSNDHTHVGQKITKTVNNKNLYTDENETYRYDFSDSEVTNKKNPVKVLKSCSSDTELEVSKRVEKRTRVLRKENTFKVH